MMALLRVELNAKHIVLPDRATKITTVIGDRQYIGLLITLKIE